MARVPTYEERHPIGGMVPQLASLDSFERRSRIYRGVFYGYKTGDLITFPPYVRVATIRSYRFIIVNKNGEDQYFPIACLYDQWRQNGTIITTSIAKDIEKYESDSEIIRALLGHTIKCIHGSEAWTIENDHPAVGDFELLDPPLTDIDDIWYSTDSSYLPRASEEYVKLQKQLWNCGINEYLTSHYGIEDSAHLYLLMDKGFNIDDNGLIVAPVLMKDANDCYTVIREATIGISPLSMLERLLDSKYNCATTGIRKIRTIETLKKLLDSDKIIIELTQIPFATPYFRCHPLRLSTISIADDIGKLAFPSRNEVSIIKKSYLPDILAKRKYTLVGTSYHVPYTQTKSLSCILIARDDNPHDSNAIEVRRWFPRKLSKFSLLGRPQKTNPVIYDGVYELGFISRQENKDLHEFMMKNDCRLLFGETDTNGALTILGGIEQFSAGSLNGFAIPFSLLNLEIRD